MAKLLFIIAPKNFRDEELFEPKKVLEEEGHIVEVCSTEKVNASGMLGGSYKVDLTAKDALGKEYDGIVVVGGSGSPELAEHSEVLEIIKKIDSQNKLVASICLGGTVLARAGVLQGKRATVWSSGSYQRSIQILKEEGAKYTDEKVVVDGRVITAFGPDFAYKFGREIADWLEDNL